MRNGIVRQFLLLAVIILLSKESIAYILTPEEQAEYSASVESCSQNAALGGNCVYLGDKIIQDGPYIRLAIFFRGDLCIGNRMNNECLSDTSQCICGYRFHGEWIEHFSNSTPTETPTCKGGSIINVNEGTLGESVMIVGTPFDLIYSSEHY